MFGGTFDPIHIGPPGGRRGGARDAFGLERVVFIPAAVPPHKAEVKVTPPEQRLAMVEAAIADNPAFEASRIEIERGGRSFTLDTLVGLRALWPGVETRAHPVGRVVRPSCRPGTNPPACSTWPT